MRLFSVLIDFDCFFDTRGIYKNSWGSDYLNFYNTIQEKESRLMHLEIGNSFTLAVTKDSKIYSWGLNDNCQLARPKKKKGIFYPPEKARIFNNINPKVIASGDEHSLLLDYSDNLYTWGSNIDGQLGLGHSKEIPSIIKLRKFEKKIKTVVAKGKFSYALTYTGDVWKWPFEGLEIVEFTPYILKNIEEGIKITNISCGYGFLIAISDNGMAFSTGQNEEGQLGLDDRKKREELTLIETFLEKREKVLEVACGGKHSICKTYLGRVYTWGHGANGQLGTGSGYNMLKPELVNPYNDKKRLYKAISVQAGFRISYILNEDRKVYYTGQSFSENNIQLSFKKLDFKKKVRIQQLS